MINDIFFATALVFVGVPRCRALLYNGSISQFKTVEKFENAFKHFHFFLLQPFIQLLHLYCDKKLEINFYREPAAIAHEKYQEYGQPENINDSTSLLPGFISF